MELRSEGHLIDRIRAHYPNGPCIIGATGGSGTRVLARVVRASGLFIGTYLNASEDPYLLAGYSDRWINRYVADGDAVSKEMIGDLGHTLRAHLASMPDANAPWGWKSPRSIYYLRFLASLFPALRFIHFVRDGRDMALSANQNQVKKHGAVKLSREEGQWDVPFRSTALWNRVNLEAIAFGKNELQGRYLRLRFEDLCASPRDTIARALAFFGLPGDAEALARLVEPPRSLGRWRELDPASIARLEEIGAECLQACGYELSSPAGAAAESPRIT